jgi:hypothetical protein
VHVAFSSPECRSNSGHKNTKENASQLKYLRMTVRNQNLTQEEIKKKLNSGSSCYHSVQNILASHQLFKNLKIRMYRTIIFPVVLYGCETWSMALTNRANSLNFFSVPCL